MRTISFAISRTIAATMAAVFLLHLSSLFAQDAGKTADQHFPHLIQHELGASGFPAGDQITITSVHGDRANIEPGGSYAVEGTYTLASADSAELALFCTSRGPSNPTHVQSSQRIKIVRGSGKFRLYETNVADGWLHVSFYHGGNSRGGVYFGQKGRENNIMRRQEWFREFAEDSKGEIRGKDVDLPDKSNRALMQYLGNPVTPPVGMDARYTKENLLKAFTTLSRKADLVINRLAVDDSEFPFLVYGILEGRHTLPEKAMFDELEGYTYGGSVRGSTSEGTTYFAVNMVPRSQYPSDQEKACNRRLMLRLQMLADKAAAGRIGEQE